MEKPKKALLAAAAVSAATIILAAVPVRVGAACGASLASRLAYPLCHANIFHAAANAWCLTAVTRSYGAVPAELLGAYAIAASVPSFVLSATPTMGLSGACFALMGMMTRRVRRKVYWNAWAAAFAAAGLFIPQVNAWLHLWCLAAGNAVAFLNSPAPWNKR